MICVGIDTACKTAAVGIMQDGKLLYESFLGMGTTHSEALLPMLDTAFRATGLTPAQVDLYGVCAGPGSFTGLRIGLAAVKGLAQPNRTPCAGVSTLAALSWNMIGSGTVVAALDARRGEVYWGAFDAETHQRLVEDRAEPLSQMENFLKNCKKPVFFVGDGAELCYNRYNKLQGVSYCPPGLRHPRAAGVCLAALAAEAEGGCVPSAQLLPTYLRLSQAERERAARLAAQT